MTGQQRFKVTVALGAALVWSLAVGDSANGARRGFVPRPCGFDLDDDGLIGESGDDCNLCDGSTKDPDGDGTAEDLIYLDATAGVDVPRCGSPRSPCKTISYVMANIIDGPGDGAEDILCLKGRFAPDSLAPPSRFSGIRGSRTRTAQGSEASDFRYPRNPAMIVPWDSDDDGDYTDETATLVNPSSLRPFRFQSGANVNDYFEIAHLRIANYGRANARAGNAFVLCDGPRARGPRYAYFHDLLIDGINRAQEHQSGNNIFHVWTCAGAKYIAFENLKVSHFGGWLNRGTLGNPLSCAASTDYIRFKNLTAIAEACDSDDRNGERCSDVDQSEITFFKTWGCANNIEVLDSVFDCNVGSAADEWLPGAPCGGATGVNSCLQEVYFRNNEGIDFSRLGNIESDNVACSFRATDGIYIDRNYYHNSYDWLTRVPRAGAPFGVEMSGNGPGEMEDVWITNNVFQSDYPVSSFVLMRAGGDEDTGSVRILGNTFLADTDPTAASGHGLVHLDNTAQRHDFPATLQIKNNIFAGLSRTGRNIWLEVPPSTTEDYDFNIYDADGDFRRAAALDGTLSAWRRTTGEEANSTQSCTPTFQADGYHLDTTDSCAKDRGTAVTGLDVDIDGEARPQGRRLDIGADELAVSGAAPAPAAGGWSLKIDAAAAGGAFFGVPERTPVFTLLVPVAYPDGAVLYCEFFDLLAGPDPLARSPMKKVLVAESIDGSRVTNQLFVRKRFSADGGIVLPPIPAGYEIQVIPKMHRIAKREGFWGFRARLERP